MSLISLCYAPVLALKGCPLSFRLYLMARGFRRFDLFPSAKTDLHLSGYPRSGNTFATGIAERYAAGLSLATHLHSNATFRLARKHHVPTIVLFRDPADAMASAYVKPSEGLLKRFKQVQRVAEYAWYYNYVLDHPEDFRLLHFKRLIAEPASLIALMHQLLGDKLPPPHNFALETVTAEVTSGLKNDSKPANRSDWQNPEKEALKQQARQHFEALPEYREAVACYQKLLKLEEEQFQL